MSKAPEELEPVEFKVLLHEELWESSDDIESEVGEHIGLGNVSHGLLASLSLHEVKEDLDRVDDINHKFDSDKSFVLPGDSFMSMVLCGRSISDPLHVNCGKDLDEGVDDQLVDDHKGDEEVPEPDKGRLGVEHVPRHLLLLLLFKPVLSFLIDVVVDHHLLLVLFRHLGDSDLESNLVVVLTGLLPKLVNSLISLELIHFKPLNFSSVLVFLAFAAKTKAGGRETSFLRIFRSLASISSSFIELIRRFDHVTPLFDVVRWKRHILLVKRVISLLVSLSSQLAKDKVADGDAHNSNKIKYLL